MPLPPESPEPATPTPTVCVCGYDLAGLAADAGAKCPECGAVVADLPFRAAWWEDPRVWLGVALAPSILIFPILLAVGPFADDGAVGGLVLSNGLITLAWLFFGTLPACRVYATRVRPGETRKSQLALSGRMYLLCAMATFFLAPLWVLLGIWFMIG